MDPPLVHRRRAVSLMPLTCANPTCPDINHLIPAGASHLAVTVHRVGEKPQRFALCAECVRRGRAGRGIDWAAEVG